MTQQERQAPHYSLRWVCKNCGKPRRRYECLSCGNKAPLTDEPFFGARECAIRRTTREGR